MLQFATFCQSLESLESKVGSTFNSTLYRSERRGQVHVPEAVAGRHRADEGRVPAEPAAEGGPLRSAFGRAPHGRRVAGRIPDETFQPATRKGKLSDDLFVVWMQIARV